jgi:hypothetical protein
LFGNIWHHFANGLTEMVLDRDSANIGEPLIDLEVTAIGTEKCKANWRGIVNPLQLWRR